MSSEVLSLQPHAFDGVVDAPGPGSKSNELWGDAPLLRAYLDPSYAHYEYHDFSHFDADDDWVVTNFTAGTADVIDGAGGILQLDAASATADQGVQIQRKIETFLPAADKSLWYEARLKVTDTIAGVQLFAGLSVLDVTMFAAGIPTMADYIGWSLDAVQQAATASTPLLELNSTAGSKENPTDAAQLLVEDTYIRLGFKLTSNTTLEAFVNGVKVGSSLTITDCPATEMALSFVCIEEGGAVDPITSIDWVRCLQIR